MMRYVAVAAMACIQTALSSVLAASTGPQVGTPAPLFKTRSLVMGDPVDLNELRGRVVILTFWASRCGPCRREPPILESAQRQIDKNELTVLEVNFRDSPEAIGQLKKLDKNWQASLLEDSHGWIASLYKIKSIPHLFMIGRDGLIIANHTGYGDKSVDELVADINKALRDETPGVDQSSAVPRAASSTPPQ